MSSLMLLGTRGWLQNHSRLDIIEEEDLQELLEQCEHDQPQLRPMPIKTDHYIHNGLPACVDIILRILNYVCFCFW